MLPTLFLFRTSNKANFIAFHFEESSATYYSKMGRNKKQLDGGYKAWDAVEFLYQVIYTQLDSPAKMLCGNPIGSLTSTSSFEGIVKLTKSSKVSILLSDHLC